MDSAQQPWTSLSIWLADAALPLWSITGFDRQRGAFVERLSLDRQAIAGVPRRLMVQARQIYSFATAAERGWLAGADELALTAVDAMVRDYFEPDGQPGWVMSVDDAGRTVDPQRDLYGHAFALLGLASAYRVEANPRYLDYADRTLRFLDKAMAAPAGGYVSAWPSSDDRLRQNPHMHLLEALLALHEVAPHAGHDQRADALVTLFSNRLFQRPSCILPECFDTRWQPLPGDAGRSFEPGHHHEWAWLLDRHALVTGRPRSTDTDLLIGAADRLGRSPDGSLWSEVRNDGVVLDASARLWPHTEAIKSALIKAGGDADGERAKARASAWLGQLHQRFIEPAPAGGWFDRVDADNRPVNDYMPASSLYHVVCALAEYERKVGPPITALGH